MLNRKRPIEQYILHKGCDTPHLVLQVDYVNKEVIALVDDERGNQETYKFEDITEWQYKELKAMSITQPAKVEEYKATMFHITQGCVKAEDELLLKVFSEYFGEKDLFKLKALVSQYVSIKQMQGVYDRYDIIIDDDNLGPDVHGMIVKGFMYDETDNTHKWVVTFYPNQSIFK